MWCVRVVCRGARSGGRVRGLHPRGAVTGVGGALDVDTIEDDPIDDEPMFNLGVNVGQVRLRRRSVSRDGRDNLTVTRGGRDRTGPDGGTARSHLS